MDCRPTQSRMVGDHYEVKVDGEWMRVPRDKISNGRARWWCSCLRSETGRPQQKAFYSASSSRQRAVLFSVKG